MIQLRKSIQRIIGYLEKYELYFKFKYTPIVYAFVKKKNPKLQRSINAESKLYKSVLIEMPAGAVIFDIGANLGFTTEIFFKTGGVIVAVEPDLINLNSLRARFSKEEKVTIVPKAVSDSIGEEVIYLDDNGNALHTLSNKWKTYLEGAQNDRWKNKLTFSKKRTIQTTTIEALIQKYGVPYFIKIDVEGYEEKVIKGLNTSIPLISFEANLPQFLEETIRCIIYLDGLSKTAVFNYAKNDKLLLPQFVTRHEIVKIISGVAFRYIDVFCKM